MTNNLIGPNPNSQRLSKDGLRRARKQAAGDRLWRRTRRRAQVVAAKHNRQHNAPGQRRLLPAQEQKEGRVSFCKPLISRRRAAPTRQLTERLLLLPPRKPPGGYSTTTSSQTSSQRTGEFGLPLQTRTVSANNKRDTSNNNQLAG